MNISRTLSLLLVLVAVPTLASPSLGQSPGSTQEPSKARTKAKRAKDVKEVTPGTVPPKQGKQKAGRVQDARDKKKAERVQNARDKKKAERVQGVRDKKKAERTGQARNKQQTGKDSARAADARAKMKSADTKALRSLSNQIKIHEANVARIDKLAEIFTRKRDSARIEQVRKLRSAEEKRYEGIIGRFKKALGEERFTSVRARLETSKRKH